MIVYCMTVCVVCLVVLVCVCCLYDVMVLHAWVIVVLDVVSLL